MFPAEPFIPQPHEFIEGLAGGLVGEKLVGGLDLLEEGRRIGVVGPFVGMADKGSSSVGLADIGHRKF